MKAKYLSLFLSIFSCFAFSQKLKTVAYKDGNQKLNGMATITSAKNKPGVLILPAWKGIDNEAKTSATEFAKLGYNVFIADIYGDGNIPADNAAAAKISGYYKTNYAEYQKRISLALQQLQKNGADPNRIAVIGYCFGGTGALEAMRGNLSVKAIASIHGGLAKDSTRASGPISQIVLIEHPAEDQTITQEDLTNLQNELTAGKADWQLITYANSGHTFTNPESPEYNAVMAKRAWKHLVMFLNEVLQ